MGKETFRSAVERHDLEGMIAALAPDAVLHSPISFTPFEGREAIAMLFSALVEIFEDLHYTDQLEGADGTRALIFRARIGERQVEGMDLLRFDEAGLIRDFTVMVRPRSAMEALMAAVGPRLAAKQK